MLHPRAALAVLASGEPVARRGEWGAARSRALPEGGGLGEQTPAPGKGQQPGLGVLLLVKGAALPQTADLTFWRWDVIPDQSL